MNLVNTIFEIEKFENSINNNTIKNELLYLKGYTKKDMISRMNRNQSPTNHESYPNQNTTDQDGNVKYSIGIEADDLKQK